MMAKRDGMLISDIFRSEQGTELKCPLMLTRTPAGFPSPADDYVDTKLDLNQLLIKHPAATFFVRVEGDSMVDAGIHSGDILIVDRALEASDRDVVIAVLNGGLTVKRIKKTADGLFLAAENPEFGPLEVTKEMDFEVWGVVTHAIHQVE